MHRHTALSVREGGFTAASEDITSTSSVSQPRHNVTLIVKLWVEEKLSSSKTVNMMKQGTTQLVNKAKLHCQI